MYELKVIWASDQRPFCYAHYIDKRGRVNQVLIVQGEYAEHICTLRTGQVAYAKEITKGMAFGVKRKCYQE